MILRLIITAWLSQIFIFAACVQAGPIRYVAVGDSYTVGAGIDPSDSWPSQLKNRLNGSGIVVELAANLGQTGWTAEQAIAGQLPKLKVLKPDFVTLLIGVNDWIRGVNNKDFTYRLRALMDGIQEALTNPKNLLAITIPDFSCSPEGKKWGYGKSAVNGIARLNKIIKREAAERSLPLVDITSLSRKLCAQPDAFSDDGVHPSGTQYSQWVDLMFIPAHNLLRKK